MVLVPVNLMLEKFQYPSPTSSCASFFNLSCAIAFKSGHTRIESSGLMLVRPCWNQRVTADLYVIKGPLIVFIVSIFV